LAMGFFKWISGKLNPPNARIVFWTQKNEYSFGEEVKGDAQITSEEEFDTIEIAVGLSCWENLKKTRNVTKQYGQSSRQTQEQYWDQAELYKNRFVICGEAHIPQGFNAKYPFVIRIPPVARETYYSVDNNVKWWIHAWIMVRGRPSIETENREILITKLQSPPPTQTISREVIKELVLIPCSYCSSLMPQTSVFCPNCGARRRA